MTHKTLRHLPFWLLIAGAWIALVGSMSMLEGYFMDGMQYGTMARNLSEGLGSFTHPMLSETFFTDFHHSLPLGLFMESLFFRVFGDHVWTEKLYGLVMALLQIVLIVKIWRQLHSDDPHSQQFSWLPVVLWVSVPVIQWIFVNNMLEMTSGVFVLLAVSVSLTGIHRKQALWFVLAGLLILAAVMSKTVVGLFPLATVPLYGLLMRTVSWKRIIGYTLVTLATVVLTAWLLLLHEDFADMLGKHLDTMLKPSLEGKRGLDRGFYHVMKRLFYELLPMMGLFVLLLVIFRKKLVHQIQRRKALFLFLLGLAGSAPIMISQKQAGYYAAPSIAFFALCFAVMCLPAIRLLVSNIRPKSIGNKVFIAITSLLIIAGTVFTFVRPETHLGHRKKLTAIDALLPHLPPKGNIIGCSNKVRLSYEVGAYLYRKKYISIDKHEALPFYLSYETDAPPEGYTQRVKKSPFVVWIIKNP